MFKLVGKETFCVGAAKTKATISIDPVRAFAYEYTLEINGKSLKKYMENRSKTTSTWVLHLDSEDFRVVLGKWKPFLQNFFFSSEFLKAFFQSLLLSMVLNEKFTPVWISLVSIFFCLEAFGGSFLFSKVLQWCV